MTVKLCLLKNQTTIVCDVKEALDKEENKSLGYIISDPFTIECVNNVLSNVDEDMNVTDLPTQQGELQFGRLFPLSNERSFNVTHDFIEVIYEPHADVTNAYISILSKWVQEYVKTLELDNSFLVHSDEIGGNQNEIWSDVASGTPTVER
jgi:hypothetical protein